MCGRLLKKECEWCGEDFHTINPDDRFCDNRCLRNEPEKAKLDRRVCEGCGISFQPLKWTDTFCKPICRQRSYACKGCGSQCRSLTLNHDGHCDGCRKSKLQEKMSAKLARRTCEVCGTSFQPVNRTNEFCSFGCQQKSQYERQKHRVAKTKAYYPNKKCKRCKSSFSPKTAQHKFCKSECRESFYRDEQEERTRSKLPIPPIVCEGCGSEFATLNPKQTYCTSECRESSIAADRWIIFARDEFRCFYCGKNSDDSSLHVDHIYPWSKGGADVAENLVTACERCNLSKGSKVMSGPLLKSVVDRVRKRNEIAGIAGSKVIKGSHVRGEPRQNAITTPATTTSNVPQLSQT